MCLYKLCLTAYCDDSWLLICCVCKCFGDNDLHYGILHLWYHLSRKAMQHVSETEQRWQVTLMDRLDWPRRVKAFSLCSNYSSLNKTFFLCLQLQSGRDEGDRSHLREITYLSTSSNFLCWFWNLQMKKGRKKWNNISPLATSCWCWMLALLFWCMLWLNLL